jgi:histidine triad (HIT) family protein
MSSVFTKIINGEIPSYKVFENELVFAFLDIAPIRTGHTLIIPKVEVDYFVDVPEPYYSEVFKIAKILAPAIQKATDYERIGGLVEGLEVPHFHYHLIPLVEGERFLKERLSPEKTELEEVQKKILENLNQT